MLQPGHNSKTHAAANGLPHSPMLSTTHHMIYWHSKKYANDYKSMANGVLAYRPYHLITLLGAKAGMAILTDTFSPKQTIPVTAG